MKKKLIILICLFMWMLSSNCIAKENYNSISRIEGNKIYLKHDGIKINEKGILIYIQGKAVSISCLEQDEEGLYFNYHQSGTWDWPPLCPVCNAPWVIRWCSNPECPTNKE